MRNADPFQAIAVTVALGAVMVLSYFAAPWTTHGGATPSPGAASGSLSNRVFARAPVDLPPPEDAELADRVRELLDAELGLDLPRAEVSVQAGWVTLQGPASSLAEARRARALVSALHGVRGVDDRFALPRLPEARIRAREALQGQQALAGLGLQVREAPGGLVLEGRVPSLGHRRLALEVAGGVRGMGRLESRLEVVPRPARQDSAIRGEVERLLRVDALMEEGDLGVEVREGVVTLSGLVATEAERLRALRDAEVPGAREVQAEGLEVRPRKRQPGRPVTPRSEAEILQGLHEGFRGDPRIAEDVEVDLVEGVAVLRGSVSTLRARRAAVAVASSGLGVRRVRDRLRVTPGEPPSREEVLAALDRSPWLEGRTLGVRSAAGTVHLEGTVDDAWERQAAQDAVEGLPGVVRVENRLEVRDLRLLPEDPFLGDPVRLDSDPDLLAPAVTCRRDAELQQAVEERLRWNPFVIARDLEVHVSDGVARLGGTVHGLAELRSARATALRAGAVRVDDELEYQP